MTQEVDRARTEALAKALFAAVLPTLRTKPPSRENVLVALNATAWLAATIIAGAQDGAALEFFTLALTQNLAELTKGDVAHG